MKLISNFKDYYDGAMYEFGYSTDVIYNRLNSVHVIPNGEPLPKEFKRIDKYINNLNVVIGFCGKIYHALLVKGNPGEKDYVYYPYSSKDIKVLKAVYDREKKNGRYYTQKTGLEKILISVGEIEDNTYYKPDVKGFLNIVEDHDIFQEFGCISFVYYRKTCYSSGFLEGHNGKFFGSIEKYDLKYSEAYDVIIKNPILKEFDFQKIVNSYEAIQEIEMYIGRLAENNVPKIPVGSDKVIAESKGFDKWSFRKMPENGI